MFVKGRVQHPDDLRPAIEALGEAGREFLERETDGREPTPRDIARAADFERGELEWPISR